MCVRVVCVFVVLCDSQKKILKEKNTKRGQAGGVMSQLWNLASIFAQLRIYETKQLCRLGMALAADDDGTEYVPAPQFWVH